MADDELLRRRLMECAGILTASIFWGSVRIAVAIAVGLLFIAMALFLH